MDGRAPITRLTGRDAEARLDKAAIEGAAWVESDRAPSPDGALAALMAITDRTPRDRPLLLLGTDVAARVPLNLLLTRGAGILPVPDGSLRPSARILASSLDTIPGDYAHGVLLVAEGGKGASFPAGFDELASALPPDRWAVARVSTPDEIARLVDGEQVVHLAGHGEYVGGGQAAIRLSPEHLLRAEDIAQWKLAPGALVVLAACETAGGIEGDLPMDLPMAAMRAGAGAVLWSRYPVRSRVLHEALRDLYGSLPLRCDTMLRRWHTARSRPRLDPVNRSEHLPKTALLGMELGLSPRCVPNSPP